MTAESAWERNAGSWFIAAENRGVHGGGGVQAHRDDHVTPGGEEAGGAGGRGHARHGRGRAHVIGDDHATEPHLLTQQPHHTGENTAR